MIEYYKKYNQKNAEESNKKFDALMNMKDIDMKGKPVKWAEYDLPDGFIDIETPDPLINKFIEDVAIKQADEYDRMIIKALKDGFLYIVTYNEVNNFDIENGVYTSSKTMLPTKTPPMMNFDLDDYIYLQPILDKFVEWDVDYMNMSYEELKEVFDRKAVSDV